MTLDEANDRLSDYQRVLATSYATNRMLIEKGVYTTEEWAVPYLEIAAVMIGTNKED